ncbi:MAG TPA: hypothetical protein VIK69_02530 [Methylophilaceae bacterium]|jgi:hypothetical protein
MKPRHVLLAIVQALAFNIADAAVLEGRLFTTPVERVRLDQLRQSSKLPTSEDWQEQENPEPQVTVPDPVVPGSVSVQGYITRSDGRKGTVWINNMPLQEGDEAGAVRVKRLPQNGGQVHVSIPAIGRELRLKAGQIYVPETDSITEERARMSEQPVVDSATGLEANQGAAH